MRNQENSLERAFTKTVTFNDQITEHLIEVYHQDYTAFQTFEDFLCDEMSLVLGRKSNFISFQKRRPMTQQALFASNKICHSQRGNERVSSSFKAPSNLSLGSIVNQNHKPQLTLSRQLTSTSTATWDKKQQLNSSQMNAGLMNRQNCVKVEQKTINTEREQLPSQKILTKSSYLTGNLKKPANNTNRYQIGSNYENLLPVRKHIQVAKQKQPIRTSFIETQQTGQMAYPQINSKQQSAFIKVQQNIQNYPKSQSFLKTSFLNTDLLELNKTKPQSRNTNLNNLRSQQSPIRKQTSVSSRVIGDIRQKYQTSPAKSMLKDTLESIQSPESPVLLEKAYSTVEKTSIIQQSRLLKRLQERKSSLQSIRTKSSMNLSSRNTTATYNLEQGLREVNMSRNTRIQIVKTVSDSQEQSVYVDTNMEMFETI
ncbi:UNKNOWN [Stylonychia lemnae]|uniref:Uncharacterized protein n=1 Tax=Stylonychia lemnae TaxID=5949 RepID=A0A078BC10_STYLE|nr:UNKNOWN [Stylonychia lemnae]|eukprot:CDW91138.1 UNKNOWN [Stylonychia lemnae]